VSASVGILGGTFDPVHRGHVALAETARRALGLDRVLLLPCSVPPHKPERRIAPAFERLEMLHLALEGRTGLAVATDEIGRGGVCYTIDTLRARRLRGDAPVFLIGSDALAEIETWREYRALLEEFDLVAVERAPTEGVGEAAAWPAPARERLLDGPLPSDLGRGGRIVRLPVALHAVSSRLVRARAAASLPVGDLVPARVARYIQLRRPYRQEASR
jgi:nicotinate-nucleotide adenylyltransferase